MVKDLKRSSSVPLHWDIAILVIFEHRNPSRLVLRREVEQYLFLNSMSTCQPVLGSYRVRWMLRPLARHQRYVYRERDSDGTN